MNPALRQLLLDYPELTSFVEEQSLEWTFDQSIKKLGPEFYSKLMPVHPILDLEYGVVCNQICYHLTNYNKQNKISQEKLIEHLKSALMYSQLLEQLNLHYLHSPSEVERLRKQQQIYCSLLKDLGNYNFPTIKNLKIQKINSLTQYIRNNTAAINWYRLLLTRSKRVLNLVEVVGTNSKTYSQFIVLLDKYTNPFFSHLAWCFFVPRLAANLFLLTKHSIPGPWMDDNEKVIGAWVRFSSQLMRRGFEINNDVAWITVGLLNCFVLVGVLAPVAVYASLAAFAFDALNIALRTAVELNRLAKINKRYEDLYAKADTVGKKEEIREFQKFLEHRIEFEKLRLAISLFNAVAVFAVMALAIPALASNPVLPLIGACLLIAVWIFSYTMTHQLEKTRPKQNLEESAKASQLGMFAGKKSLKDKQLTPVEKADSKAQEVNNLLPNLKSP